MCGISGAIAINSRGIHSLDKIQAATDCLKKRGPDYQAIFRHGNIALGHARLSIIDTSDAASQPMQDSSGRYTIIFNGEFFNYQEHRQLVLDKGFQLRTESDTEILLYLYILEGPACLQRVNGFFALAVYDKQEDTVFIARDRMGIKPLYYYRDENRFLFGSELKAMMALGVPRELDQVSLYTYLQLNYIPGPHSIFKNVKKLEPGHYFYFKLNDAAKINPIEYYRIPKFSGDVSTKVESDYSGQQKRFKQLLNDAVQRRLVSDVPLGAFLSGGIDSSVVVALAAQHTPHLKTFSIGFQDEPLYDETHYAELVAKKFNTNHTTFRLRNDDLYSNLFAALDYLDEPFADSSALNVFILSKETRKHVTVALSGDGADELFGGYNKHAAEYRARNGGLLNVLLKHSAPLLRNLPQSRSNRSGDLVRKASRMAEGLSMQPSERYWRWAAFESEEKALHFFNSAKAVDRNEYSQRKNYLLRHLQHDHDLQEVLYTDMQLVLVNDMLVKVDMMSMANSLEVRVPFLDYTVVDYAFSLPLKSKIDGAGRKKILRDAFRDDLPAELYHRTKKGFEVPLLKWFRNELRELIENDLLGKDFVREQGLFQVEQTESLKKKLFSSSSGDAPAQIWALLVFQYWWKKWMQDT